MEAHPTATGRPARIGRHLQDPATYRLSRPAVAGWVAVVTGLALLVAAVTAGITFAVWTCPCA